MSWEEDGVEKWWRVKDVIREVWLPVLYFVIAAVLYNC